MTEDGTLKEFYSEDGIKITTSRNTQHSTFEETLEDDPSLQFDYEMAEYVQGVIENGEPWTDPEFPPEFCSLYKESVTSIDEEAFIKLEWKRASQIFEEPVVFCDKIIPANIECGAIGTYYFLAVLCEMAEAPERILDVILTSENAAGIYELKFFINGVLTSVLVDDYLPVLRGTNQIAFARSK